MLVELWHDVRYRIKVLIRRGDIEGELEAELADHLAREAEVHERRGLSAAEARRLARAAFGGMQNIKEQSRLARGTTSIESVGVDVRQAIRGFRAAPGFTIGVCLTLALGIGANSAVFAAIDGILLRPLPYPAPDRLVTIAAVRLDSPAVSLAPTVPEYLAWSAATREFEAVAVLSAIDGDLAADEPGAPSQRIVVQKCTASLFAVLAVEPELGRVFTPDEDPVGSPSGVVVISHRLWQRRFGGDPAVLGRVVHIDGRPQVVVGVMPEAYGLLPDRIDVWAPVNWSPAAVDGSARGWPVLARLRPGVTIDAAESELNELERRAAADRGARPIWGARLTRLDAALARGIAKPLAFLQGMVGVVFLIACATVAGLLLQRAIARRGELAIRAAVGAGRGRIVRQWLTESVLLAALGGVAAVGVARGGLAALLAAAPAPVPRIDNVGMTGSVLLFTGGLSILSVLLFGTIPALFASRSSGVRGLRSCGRTRTGAPGFRWMRGGLVVVQIALATVLLAGTALLALTLIRIAGNDIGGDPSGVLTSTIRFPPARFDRHVGSDAGLPLLDISPQVAVHATQALDRIAHLPGVRSAAVTSLLPFSGEVHARPFLILDHDSSRATARDAPHAVNAQIVSPRFFSTLRIDVLRGRGFSERDTAASPWVAVVNESMAATYWPGSDPIGQWLLVDSAPDERPRRIVGVVADTRASVVARDAMPTLYTLFEQQPRHLRAPYVGDRLLVTFLARTIGDPRAIGAAMRTALADIDPGLPHADVHPLAADVDAVVSIRRYLLVLMGVLAGLATVMAAAGLSGATGHHMAQRLPEIGIRMALGATAASVWRMALAETAWLLAAGAAVGIALAIGLARLMASILWGVAPTDIGAYLVVCTLMASVALLSALGPTRRVLRVEPTRVLRLE